MKKTFYGQFNMSYKSIQLGDAIDEVVKLTKKSCDEILTKCEEATHELGKETIVEMKKITPNKIRGWKHKSYKSCYTLRKTNKYDLISRTIWNRQYQLSHLLEKGHKVYTRPRGTKRMDNVSKLGPFLIKKRTYQFGVVTDAYKTASEGFWQAGVDYIQDNILKKLKEKIEKK